MTETDLFGHLVEADPTQPADVPVKYSSTNPLPSPIASKICDPVYEATVEMPIFDMIFKMPLPEALM